MNKYLLLLLFAVLCAYAKAQNSPRYQGEVNIGYGFGMGDYQMDRFYIETIHGVRIIPNLFLGAGAGLALLDNGHATIPVFADIKGYLTKSKIAPYIFANLGYGFGDEKGFYGAGGLGVDFSVAPTLGVFINIGYQSLGIADNIQENGTYGPSNMGAFLIQAGFRF